MVLFTIPQMDRNTPVMESTLPKCQYVLKLGYVQVEGYHFDSKESTP